MIKINLREFYPECYRNDYFVEVPEELAEQLVQWNREDDAYERQRYRNRAHYSLDRGDGIEHDILFVAVSPDELYERKLSVELLHKMIAALPEKQARRIYAHYLLGWSQSEIARAEGVTRNVVCKSIRQGLRKLMDNLVNFSV